MITISVVKQMSCPIRADEVKKRVTAIFRDNGIVSDAEAEVAIVDEKQMLEYVEKYLHETGPKAKAHPVLSFVQTELEGPFQFPPDNTLHLGEIIVSYPHAVQLAQFHNKTATEAVCELAEHAALHLLGIHHN